MSDEQDRVGSQESFIDYGVFRLEQEDIVFLVIDVQDSFFEHVVRKSSVRINLEFLLRVIPLFEIPILVTEQYPKGIGPTSQWVRDLLSVTPIPKTRFSCLQDPEFQKAFHRVSMKQTIVITGIETHICVYQTTLDFLDEGYDVVILRDAVSSRFLVDHEAGLERLRSEGAIIMTTEQFVFELLGGSDSPIFKQILPLIKEKDHALRDLEGLEVS